MTCPSHRWKTSVWKLITQKCHPISNQVLLNLHGNYHHDRNMGSSAIANASRNTDATSQEKPTAQPIKKTKRMK
jgi:hypothetical protein